MSNPTEIAERYIAAWNETDDAGRRKLVASTWTETGTYVDPMMSGAGQDGIDAMIRAAQSQFPGLRFRLDGKVDAHHDRLRFSWALGPDGGAPVAKGTDFAVVGSDARLQSVTGFIDQMPAP